MECSAAAAKNHAGFRLAASAMIRIGVEADLDVVDGELGPNQFVHRLDGRARRATGGHIRLICADDDEIARLFEPAHRILDAGQETELSESGRRNRFAVALEIGVDHAVAIEKDGRPHHLVTFPLQFRVRDEAVPDHRLECQPRLIDRRDHHDDIAGFPGIAAVAADDAEDL